MCNSACLSLSQRRWPTTTMANDDDVDDDGVDDVDGNDDDDGGDDDDDRRKRPRDDVDAEKTKKTVRKSCKTVRKCSETDPKRPENGSKTVLTFLECFWRVLGHFHRRNKPCFEIATF